MKKAISLFLAFLLSCSLLITASAEYTVLEENSKTFSSIYSKKTQYEGIYANDAYDYAMKVDDNGISRYIPLEKIEIGINEDNKVREFSRRTDIPKEVIQDFIEVYEQQKKIGSSNFKAVLFTPAPEIKASSPDVFYHQDSSGRDMMGYKYFYYNLSTGWKDVKRGTGTKTVASSLTNVALITAGMANKYISYAQSGANLLQVFYNHYGVNNVTASTSDYLEARLVWDETKQYTYAYDGEWKLGLYTSYVIVKKIGVEEYFYKSGKAPYTSDRTVNVHIYSKHYYNPWDYASAHMYNYVEEGITWKSNGITFYF